MMIPPTIRIGPPPQPSFQDSYVVLLARYGWRLALWSQSYGFYFNYAHGERIDIRTEDILCWMPQDGS